MGEQEGIDLLLESAAILLARGRDDIQFCLMGGGPSLARLEGDERGDGPRGARLVSRPLA